uniref:beta-galactoside alpha-(2,6)-sialyltransferase n=1 Tax=Tetraselmis sp. GSL018 TaxID=582737 RepID=A0A061RJZ9_9CHLO
MSNWTAGFEGEMVLNRRKMATRTALTVHLPGKEQESDNGYRELVGSQEGLQQLNSMLPEEDRVLRGVFYRSCAVVGSSGIVLNYENGEEIDRHDLVFRFNSAPTKGYEKHVGSKTTHRITNTQNWGFHEDSRENILVHFRAKSAIRGLYWNQRQRRKLKIFAFDPEFVEYMAFSLDFLATSGLYGIVAAMHRCAKVDLYGFQVSTSHGALYHYYDVCDVPANVGRDDSEYNVVRAFAKAGLVNFREPCIIECHNSIEECAQCKELSGFKEVPMPSDAKCAPGRVARGHLEAPWRRERHRHHGHTS